MSQTVVRLGAAAVGVAELSEAWKEGGISKSVLDEEEVHVFEHLPFSGDTAALAFSFSSSSLRFIAAFSSRHAENMSLTRSSVGASCGEKDKASAKYRND